MMHDAMTQPIEAVHLFGFMKKRKGAFAILSDSAIEMITSGVIIALGIYAIIQVQTTLPPGPATNATSNVTAGLSTFAQNFPLIALTLVIVVLVSLFLFVRGALRQQGGGSGL